MSNNLKPTREQIIEGYHAVADLLRDNPAITTPDMATYMNRISVYTDAAGVDAMVATCGRPVQTNVGAGADPYLRLTWLLSGVSVELALPVDELCERMVTGAFVSGGVRREVVEWIVPDHLQPEPTQTTETVKVGA